MMKILVLAIAVAFASIAPTPYSAYAQVNDHHSVPLVVVRFNEPRIYFKRPMANAVQRALQISPDVGFKVIHYTPGSGSSQTQEKAQRDLQSVLKHLYGLGVRQGNVEVHHQKTAGLGHSEVHLYVR